MHYVLQKVLTQKCDNDELKLDKIFDTT